MISSRVITVDYCDDIRQEVGGKYSLMGCYGSEMIVESLPVVLPKFCARVQILTPSDKPFSSLVLKAKFNEESIAELEMPVSKIHEQFQKVATSSELGRVALQAMMVFSPFSIAESGKLQIEAETEDEVILGSYILMIRERTLDDPIT